MKRNLLDRLFDFLFDLFFVTKTDEQGQVTHQAKWWASTLGLSAILVLLCYVAASSLSTALGLRFTTWQVLNLILAAKFIQVAFKILNK